LIRGTINTKLYQLALTNKTGIVTTGLTLSVSDVRDPRLLSGQLPSRPVSLRLNKHNKHD